ncbi:3-hydroxyacyl-CoA dehydrogenase [Rhizobium sp. CF142]|uniref:3-hydroxyacyl-CoA dehydrogenase n=1 Tax=Rhizobium sp. CF142 TaxID=1144314 RepID=UPI00026EFEE1|nr:3-hydroxyacyl-CoA dehydrogenase [Rhizobium sp. CF142]EJJ29269.1 3-hydroxyacyl-CoA dehydrogenase [Rhizobium sp. CF142]
MSNTQRNVGIIGAGTMGGGIAIAFANAGYEVQLVDVNADALKRGIERIRSFYEDAVKREKMSAPDSERRFSNITPSTSLDAVSACGLVIEAVYEDLALKSRIAAELADICPPDAILASNTSSLDINQIAQASRRPDRFVGIHFFSPAHIMKLVEVIRGSQSSQGSIDFAVDVMRALGKVPVVCGVGFGFIGNRMAEPYLREAEALILEGATPERIDAVAQSPELLGMAMGPCRMMDLAGNDIGASIVGERASETNLLDDKSYRCMVRALAEMGFLGQKTGRGFYRYEGRQPLDEPQTIALALELANRHGIKRRDDISDEEILQRLLFSLINEGFEVLREGVANDEDDIDVVFTAGFGFPKFRGGPMTMARKIGLGTIRRRLESFARQHGDPYGYWTVSPLLIEQAQVEER